ncbi:hypothetical protein ACFFJY_07930 [Fictibacillus aquaticus]|uniref:hypothetical protein n=1 Tax=Fictibacillus aquaticus TaxID=2021314 RepID=UPI0013FDB6C8|nr:hypothetical protein [Fictibacillus aquaticus]
MSDPIRYFVQLPLFYWTVLAKNEKRFMGYVHGYLAKAYPEFSAVKVIRNKHVICMRRNDYEKWKTANASAADTDGGKGTQPE